LSCGTDAHRDRLHAQLLSGPAGTAEEAVRRIVAVQGQDPRGFRLAVRARTQGVTAADVDAALTQRRTLVVSWLNRGTLHLVTADDYWWLHDLTTPQLTTGNNRRLQQEGVSPEDADRGVAIVAEQLADGPRTRAALRDVLAAAGVPTAGQALVHVLFAATLRHRVVRGPVCDGEHAYVLAEHWLSPAPAPLDRPEALGLLARRYLAGHGPAEAADLAVWAGLPLRDARAGLARIAEETVTRDGAVDLADRAPAPALPPPRLLGAFDPVLHGWRSRAAVLEPHTAEVVAGGIFRPFALVGGRAVGTWRLDGGRVRLRLCERLDPHATDALEQDAAAVLRFLGLPPRPATAS
jgi:Winged helix DNA-binding domain